MSLTIFELIELVLSSAVIGLIVIASLWRAKGSISPFSALGINESSFNTDLETDIIYLVVVILIVGATISIQESGTLSEFIFVLFYLLVPLVVSIFLFSKGTNESALGKFALFKGLFYFFLVVISMLQYIYEENTDLGRLALGFTLSIAVLESAAGFFEGVKWIKQKFEKS